MKPSKMELRILAVLGNAAIDGVAIAERLKARFGRRRHAGAVYEALTRLHHRAWVAADDSPRNRRRHYRLEPEGAAYISRFR